MSQRARQPEGRPVLVEAMDFADASENYIGWCTECEEFTRECTEPDAENYRCPNCDGLTVKGAEQALICGDITIEGEIQ